MPPKQILKDVAIAVVSFIVGFGLIQLALHVLDFDSDPKEQTDSGD